MDGREYFHWLVAEWTTCGGKTKTNNECIVEWCRTRKCMYVVYYLLMWMQLLNYNETSGDRS